MSHFSKEQWLSFVMGSEIGRISMEAHLQRCDDCLEQYATALEAHAAELPQPPNLEELVLRIAETVRTDVPERKAKRTGQRSLFAYPILHYAIAASITIVLVGSGAFQQLFDCFTDLSRQTEQGTTTAISEQLTNKAGQWLDAIPEKYAKKEGKP